MRRDNVGIIIEELSFINELSVSSFIRDRDKESRFDDFDSFYKYFLENREIIFNKLGSYLMWEFKNLANDGYLEPYDFSAKDCFYGGKIFARYLKIVFYDKYSKTKGFNKVPKISYVREKVQNFIDKSRLNNKFLSIDVRIDKGYSPEIEIYFYLIEPKNSGNI